MTSIAWRTSGGKTDAAGADAGVHAAPAVGLTPNSKPGKPAKGAARVAIGVAQAGFANGFSKGGGCATRECVEKGVEADGTRGSMSELPTTAAYDGKVWDPAWCRHMLPPVLGDGVDRAGTPVGRADENEGARGVGSPAEAPDGAQEPLDGDVVGKICSFCDAVGKVVVGATRLGTELG